MSTLSVYACYDANGQQRYVDDNDFIHTGTWSAFGSYVADRDGVIYGNSQYLAIVTNVGGSPLAPVTRTSPRKWSPLVLLYEYQGTSSGTSEPGVDAVARARADAAYNLAESAYLLAETGTNDAAIAYALAVAGTNIAGQALIEAQVAYTLATAGTNAAAGALSEALAAYALASIGTNVGTNALNAAAGAQSTANGAYNLAVAGTNAAAGAQSTANGAYSIAVAGTSAAAGAQSQANAAYLLASLGTDVGTNALNAAAAAQITANAAYLLASTGTGAAAALAQANAAYALASIGTNVGTNALNAAAAAQLTANGAYSIATAGTDAALAANNYAGAAYAIAVAGTNAAAGAQSQANAAYALAELGTVIPPLSTLPDVNIPAPTAQQVLMYDGSKWVAAAPTSTTSPVGFTFYLDDTTSGTNGYDTLSTAPTGGPEIADSITVTATEGQKPFAHAYLSGTLNRTVIDAGIWEFNTYITVVPSTGTTINRVVTKIFNRASSGVETPLFTVASDDVSALAPDLTSTITVQGTFPATLSDKLVAKYYAQTDDTGTVSMTLFHNGTAHYSHFHSPLSSRHNDLSGLQGGGFDQYYHLTLDQSGAIAGTLGTPSATNKFVTEQSLIIEQGTRSQADQVLTGNLLIEQGTRSQQDQVLLGLISIEAGTRSQEDQNLQTQVTSGSNLAWLAYTMAGTSTSAAVTVANIGTGLGLVYAQTVGGTLQFRTITAGQNISVTNGASDIIIASTASAGGLSAVNNTGTGTGQSFLSTSGGTALLRSITAGANIAVVNGASDIVISSTAAGGSFLPLAGGTLTGVMSAPNVYFDTVAESIASGTIEVNFKTGAYHTATVNGALTISGTNYGAGRGAALILTGGSVSSPLYFNTDFVFLGTQPASLGAAQKGVVSLTSLGNLAANTLAMYTATDVASTGAATTVTNIGTGAGQIYAQTIANAVQLKSITAGANITVVNGASDIIIASTASAGGLSAVNNTGTGAGQPWLSTSGGTALLRSITAGANITVANGASDIVISSTSSSSSATDVLQVQIFS